jgi:prohibitin 2
METPLQAQKPNSGGGLAGKAIIWGLILVVLAVVGLNSFGKVDYGHVALRKTFGKLSEQVLQPGIQFKLPFIQELVPVNVQVTKAEADATASSKDLQPVKTHIVVNYRVDEKAAYSLMMNVGGAYESKIIAPAIQEVLKEVTARYSAEELVSKRDMVASEVKQNLSARMQRYDLLVQDISIVNFEFSEVFNQSIEAKQVAAQQAMKAENDLKRIQIEAQQQIEQAKAQAEALRLKKQDVTEDLLRLKEIEVQEKALEKWDGKLPAVTGGAMPFIDITKVNP